MGGEAGRTAFFEAPFKKRRASSPIDFGFFLLRWEEQGRKAQQTPPRSGACGAQQGYLVDRQGPGLGMTQRAGSMPGYCVLGSGE